MPFEKGNKLGKGRPKGARNRAKSPLLASIYADMVGSFKSGRYYVYYHIVEGEIVYIGKGSGNRAWEKSDGCRNDLWTEYMKRFKFAFDVKIVAANLSEKEALAVENALIDCKRPRCNLMGLFHPDMLN